MKRVLVTGASGFIGYNTLELLKKRGYEVHAVTSKGIEHKCKDNILWHSANLLECEEVDALLSRIKPQELISFAWDTKPGKYVNSEENLSWVKSGMNILQSFYRNGGRRFVFAGTCFEYDLSYGYLTEDTTPSKPSSLYGVCKYSFESIAREYCETNNISFASGRVFYLYGQRENENRVIPYVINSLLKGEMASCSQGNQVKDFMHVEDVAQAFVSILDSEVEGVVNIGSGNPVKLRDILTKIGEKLNKLELINFGAIKGSHNEPEMIVANNNKLKSETDWIQRYSLDEGLEKTILWWERKVDDAI